MPGKTAVKLPASTKPSQKSPSDKKNSQSLEASSKATKQARKHSSSDDMESYPVASEHDSGLSTKKNKKSKSDSTTTTSTTTTTTTTMPKDHQNSKTKKKSAFTSSDLVNRSDMDWEQEHTMDMEEHEEDASVTRKLVEMDSEHATEGDEASEDENSAAIASATAIKTGKSRKVNREEQKKLLEERKSSRKHADILADAKRLWEQLKRQGPELNSEKKKQLVDQLLTVCKGKMADLTLKQDASRILQSGIKYGTQAQRQSIYKELKGHMVELSKNIYGCFLTVALMKYCPTLREAILKEFHGKIVQLMRHRRAAYFIDKSYGEYANAAQRNSIVEEFYSREFALFKDQARPKLPVFLQENVNKREAVMKYFAESLAAVINKGTLKHQLVHRLLLDFFRACDETQAQNMLALLRDDICEIVHSKEGAEVAVKCFAHANAKDRKLLLKSVKEYAVRVCKEEFGYWVLLRIFDSVDDTVLVCKMVVSELAKNLEHLLNDKYGRRPILYLLSPRSPKYFAPNVQQLLQSDAEILAKTSKKDPALRYAQLQKALLPSLITYVQKSLKDFMTVPFLTELFIELRPHLEQQMTPLSAAANDVEMEEEAEEKEATSAATKEHNKKAQKTTQDTDAEAEAIRAQGQALLEKMCDVVGECKMAADGSDLMTQSLSLRVLKNYIKYDQAHADITKNVFSLGLCDALKGSMAQYATTSGSFVILNLLENSACAERVRKELLPKVKLLKSHAANNQGAALILSKLTGETSADS